MGIRNEFSIAMSRAMSYAGLSILPNEDDGNAFWLMAIATASKTDGSKTFVIMSRDSNLNPRIIKDFGTVSPIFKIEKIYPFEVMSDDMIPKFASNQKVQRINFLTNRGVKVEDGLTVSQLDALIFKHQALKAIEIIKKEDRYGKND